MMGGNLKVRHGPCRPDETGELAGAVTIFGLAAMQKIID